jgi:hypothetical protein
VLPLAVLTEVELVVQLFGEKTSEYVAARERDDPEIAITTACIRVNQRVVFFISVIQ